MHLYPRQVEPQCGPTWLGAKMHQPRHTATLCNPSRLTYIMQSNWYALPKYWTTPSTAAAADVTNGMIHLMNNIPQGQQSLYI